MKKLFNYTIAILAFLIPVFFLPFTMDFYFLNKLMLLAVGVGILLILWAWRIIKEGKIQLTSSPLNFPILLFAICYLLSTIFISPNKVESLLNRGGLIISLTIFFFVIINNLYTLYSILYTLIASASLLSLIAIYQYIGVSQELFQLPAWMQSKIWTPSGSPLSLLTFLLPTFVLSISLALKKKESLIKILLFLAAALQMIGVILVGSLIMPGGEFAINLLPYRAGWQIAVSAFGQSPLLGIGPENFLSAFTRFRPIFLNSFDSWTIRFISSSNEYFHLFATVGALGLGAYLLLIWKLFKTRRSLSSSILYALYTIPLLQIFLPANLLLLFLEYLLLGLLIIKLKKNQSEDIRESSIQLPFLKKSPWLILVPVLVLVGGLYYLAGRVWMADYTLRESLLAAAENRGKDTYDLQIKAINLNPYLDSYRVTYAQTNLALANSIAAKTDITDQDRQNITQLVQQSIQEAKVATSLSGSKVTNWENLAGIYRNLINFAEGADQWAVAAYVQAVRLDPSNPLLRTDFGGLYFSLGNFDAAIRQFEIATELKPDYPNGYYNLASAYREKGEIQKAVNNMEAVLSLVELDSGDYQKAQTELEELKKQLPKEEKVEEVSQPETLQAPQPLPSPRVTPPIELPEESGPEIVPLPTEVITPTEEPEETPEEVSPSPEEEISPTE